MTDPMDFPLSPVKGQHYTAPNGQTYTFDGTAWTIGFYDSSTQNLTVVGDLVGQIRTLLQDVDNSGSSGYRYSTDSIVTNINMGLWEMFRVRPDIFLEVGYIVPQFSVGSMDQPWPVEEQWVPSIIYYAVGMTQLRDAEDTQDQRAATFTTKFTATLLAGA
jgi:hypothetical protein